MDILMLRDDPQVIANSDSGKPIASVAEHHLWMSLSLQNEMRRLYVIEHDKKVAGYARLDFSQDQNHAELSIALRPEWRGKGIGTELIGVLKAECDKFGVKCFARIKKDNLASIIAFAKNRIKIEVIE